MYGESEVTLKKKFGNYVERIAFVCRNINEFKEHFVWNKPRQQIN